MRRNACNGSNTTSRFDSSVGRGDGTFPVRIGTGQVIKGESVS